MSLPLASSTHLVPAGPDRGTFSALAVPSSGAGWVTVDARHLPRHAFDLVIAFVRAHGGDALADLVSLRNALTRDGKLLVVLAAPGAWGELRDLAARAGFTRVRELPSHALDSTVELQR